MRHKKPPKGMWARSTRDTSDEYFEHRIANCDDVDYLREAAAVEARRTNVRENRIATINQRIQKLNE